MSYMYAIFVNMYDNLYYMLEGEIKFICAHAAQVGGEEQPLANLPHSKKDPRKREGGLCGGIVHNFSVLLNRAMIFQQWPGL